jgi:hypothetical protein
MLVNLPLCCRSSWARRLLRRWQHCWRAPLPSDSWTWSGEGGAAATAGGVLRGRQGELQGGGAGGEGKGERAGEGR